MKLPAGVVDQLQIFARRRGWAAKHYRTIVPQR